MFLLWFKEAKGGGKPPQWKFFIATGIIPRKRINKSLLRRVFRERDSDSSDLYPLVIKLRMKS